jgi:hypothetical protein
MPVYCYYYQFDFDRRHCLVNKRYVFSFKTAADKSIAPQNIAGKVLQQKAERNIRFAHL